MNEQSKEKKRYEAPNLTVVNVKAECGYAGSSALRTLWISTFDPNTPSGDQNIEERT